MLLTMGLLDVFHTELVPSRKKTAWKLTNKLAVNKVVDETAHQELAAQHTV